MDLKSTLGNLANNAGSGGNMGQNPAGGMGQIPGMGGQGKMPVGYRGPVRIKKKQTLGGMIGGFFLGILLILGSPVVLYMAESQNTAKDFQSAQQVEATEVVDGYVTLQGQPEVVEAARCLEEECLYSNLSEEELVQRESEQCGNIKEDQNTRILYETTLECDEDGNCKQCYQVEEDVWEAYNTTTEYGEAIVGSYEVTFGEGAIMLGLEEEIVEYEGDVLRDVWTTFPVPEELRVAGDSYNGEIAGAEATYVLSPYNYAQTLAELEARDAANKWGLRIATFLMLFIGFMGIMGPLTYFSHLLRRLPIVGPFIKEGMNAIVALIAFIAAVVVFGVLWVLVTIVKNIVVAIVVLLLGMGGFGWWVKKHKADGDDSPKEDPPEDGPTAPAQPAAPEAPSEPAAPEAPSEPAAPEAPSEPAAPESPVAPEEPPTAETPMG